MTFLSRETSIFGGRPITLYEFQRGVQRWSYTNADRAQEFETRSFVPIAISDDGRRRTGEASADVIQVRVPYNNPIALMYRGVPPTDEVGLVIRDLHVGETEHRVNWSGSVIGVKFPSPERAEIIGQALGPSLNRPGLSLGWERGCPYTVYDADCGVSSALFAVDATILSMTATTITSAAFAAFADGYFAAGGFVRWPIELGNFEQRTVLQHVGSVLTLMGGTGGLQAGQALTAFPGCPRSIAICDSRFNNRPGYGGIPHLPGKSPFDGDPIFW